MENKWTYWLKLGVVATVSIIVAGVVLNYINDQKFKKQLKNGEFDCFMDSSQQIMQ